MTLGDFARKASLSSYVCLIHGEKGEILLTIPRKEMPSTEAREIFKQELQRRKDSWPGSVKAKLYL